MPNFTDLSVQKLPLGLHFDGKLSSFGMRVGKSRRTWLVIKGSNRTKVRLGHYPAMSLQEARKRAMLTLATQTEERPTMTFSDALEAFLALPRWRPSSRRVLESSLKHFTWKRTLDKITYEDVASALEAIPHRSARAHALKDIRTFFNWCVPRYLKASPCAGLKMETQPSRNRILTHDEIKAVWNACEGTFGTIVKLLLLTGQRKMEVGRLRTEYINGATVTLPAALTKNGREHTFPLGSIARSLVELTIVNRKEYLFRSSKNHDEPYNGFAFHHAELLEASGTTGWTIHDLRRTFVSLHSEIRTPIHVAEKLVNHVSGSFAGVRGIYDRYSYLEEMREACDRYEEFIHSIVSRPS